MRKSGKIATIVVVLVGLVLGASFAFGLHRGTARGPWRLEINGNLGAAVVVTATGKPDFSATRLTTDQPGTGRALTEDGQILARITDFEYRSGAVSEIATKLVASSLADEPALSKLAGTREGSRLVRVSPEGKKAAGLTVIDVLPTVLNSDGAAEPSSAHDGLPGIGVDDAGLPIVTAPGGSVSAAQTAELIAGNGIQLGEDDAVVANYMTIGPDGAVQESSWEKDAPPVLKLSEVFPGLQSALVDSRVGTRLVIAIPAREALGESDIAMVVDILALAS